MIRRIGPLLSNGAEGSTGEGFIAMFRKRFVLFSDFSLLFSNVVFTTAVVTLVDLLLAFPLWCEFVLVLAPVFCLGCRRVLFLLLLIVLFRGLIERLAVCFGGFTNTLFLPCAVVMALMFIMIGSVVFFVSKVFTLNRPPS
uniref:Transmembrane protein n=1 Tax=Cacopsylla melanoneura TaxID=428564 RepID=A0A8D8RI18_9HEMI